MSKELIYWSAWLLSRISPAASLAAILAVAWICYRGLAQAGFRRAAYWLAGGMLAIGLSDGLLLAALPYLNLSFGKIGLSWFVLTLGRVGTFLAAMVMQRRARPGRAIYAVAALLALNLAGSACVVYGFYLEPFNLSVTHVTAAPSAAIPAPIRLVQLSDLHVERTTQREQAVLETVEQLKPDLILLTGDYLNWSYINDATARRDARDLFRQLQAPYGVYAVPGTPVIDTEDALQALFADMDNITLLYDKIARLDIHGQSIYLVGVANRALERDRAALRALMSQIPRGDFAILMYHTPDLIDTASELGVNLYLAGHTHGGQIRLPLYGAIVTSSRFGKRYEAGLYQVGATQLYVSRGLGMEGLSAPRARFLCPPEIVELTLAGE